MFLLENLLLCFILIVNYSAHDSTVDCNSRGGFRAFTFQVVQT
jgi:hypothetical protein